jgi:hypothetical protein
VGTIVVTSTAGTRGGPECTLRDALTAANDDVPSGGCPAGAGDDTVVLAPAVYALDEPEGPGGSSALPVITSTLTIEGNGASVRNIAGLTLFTVVQSATLTLRNLTVQNGITPLVLPGGGVGPRQATPTTCAASSGNISNCGTLTLEGVTVTGGTSGAGAGIWNTGGHVTLIDSAVTFNTTVPLGGGGIYNDGGTVHLIGSHVSGNSAQTGGLGAPAGNGGGILSMVGTLILDSSSVMGNASGGEGGGIYATGVLSITNSTLTENSAVGDAGAIYTAGDLELRSSTLADNTADQNNNGFGDGGGLFVGAGAARVANTIIARNRDTPTNAGSGNLYPDAAADNGTSLTVFATIVTTATFTLLPDPFIVCVAGPSHPTPNCQAMSGIEVSSHFPFTWRNLLPGHYTITQNNQDVRWRLSGVPAAVDIALGSTATITTSSIYQPYIAFVPSVIAPAGLPRAPTALAQVAGAAPAPQLISAGYNLIGDGSGSPFVNGQNGDLVGGPAQRLDPLLGGLNLGSGQSMVYGLRLASPAIDHGNPAAPDSAANACPATDQSGVSRPQGPRCDIGAYEYPTAVAVP